MDAESFEVMDSGPPWFKPAMAAGRGRGRSKVGKIPKWLNVAELPPLVVAEGLRLHQATVEWIVRDISRSSFKDILPLVTSVKAHCERAYNDRFALHLFEGWLVAGADNKERWALEVLGFLGHDESARALEPYLQQWVREGQNRLATVGVTCLEHIATDTALELLRSVAGATKSKALKRRCDDAIGAIEASQQQDLETISASDPPALKERDEGAALPDQTAAVADPHAAVPSLEGSMRRLIATLINEPTIKVSRFVMNSGSDGCAPSQLSAKLPEEILSLYEAMNGFSFEWCFEDWDRCFAEGRDSAGGAVAFQPLGSLEAILEQATGESREILATDGVERGGQLTRGMNLESYLVDAPDGSGVAVYVYSHDSCAGDIAPLSPRQFVELGIALGFMFWWEDVWLRMYDTLEPEQDGIPRPETLEWMTRIRLARMGFIDPTGLTLPAALLAKIMLLFEMDERAKALFEQAAPRSGLRSYHQNKKVVDKLRALVDRLA